MTQDSPLSPTRPTRSEVRCVRMVVESPALPPSRLLTQALQYVDLGLLDGQALYQWLKAQGLQPAWVNGGATLAIRLRDPVAGEVLLCCEAVTETLH